jgi:hypothetical protein
MAVELAEEHHARLGHRLGDDGGIVRSLGDARTPGLQGRLHRRGRDRKIIEAHGGLKRLQLPCHKKPTLGVLAWRPVRKRGAGIGWPVRLLET